MADELTTYGSMSQRTASYAAARILKTGQDHLVAERFAQAEVLPKKKSKSITFRRYEDLPDADAPLAEGIPPAAVQPTFSDITVSVEQYGGLIRLTDVIVDHHEDPVLNKFMDLCGKQAARARELVTISVLKSGTNVFYANNAASRSAVNSPPLRSDLRRIYRYFRRHKAETISRIVRASAKISTEAVLPAYFVLGSTDLDADIRNMDGFLDAKNYSDSTKALPYEIGSVDQFRFILTPLFEPWLAAGASGTTYLSNGDIVSSAAKCDVYPLIVVAADSYAVVRFQGKNAVKPVVVNPHKPSHSNPLGQEGHVGWISKHAAVILNHNWLARLECAATAIPS